MIRLVKKTQNGAALITGMILLLVLTLLAVSGMTSSTLELTMAGNSQELQNAFQASESAIEAEFMQGAPGQTVIRNNTGYSFADGTTASTVVAYVESTFAVGYSTDFDADHYTITSTGAAGRGATSTHVQGFFEVVPVIN